MSDTVARIRDKFIELLTNYGISPGSRRSYAKHIEDYVKFYEGKRLRDHITADVEKYLNEKGRKPSLISSQYSCLKTAMKSCVFIEWCAVVPTLENINDNVIDLCT